MVGHLGTRTYNHGWWQVEFTRLHPHTTRCSREAIWVSQRQAIGKYQLGYACCLCMELHICSFEAAAAPTHPPTHPPVCRAPAGVGTGDGAAAGGSAEVEIAKGGGRRCVCVCVSSVGERRGRM